MLGAFTWYGNFNFTLNNKEQAKLRLVQKFNVRFSTIIFFLEITIFLYRRSNPFT